MVQNRKSARILAFFCLPYSICHFKIYNNKKKEVFPFKAQVGCFYSEAALVAGIVPAASAAHKVARRTMLALAARPPRTAKGNLPAPIVADAIALYAGHPRVNGIAPIERQKVHILSPYGLATVSNVDGDVDLLAARVAAIEDELDNLTHG